MGTGTWLDCMTFHINWEWKNHPNWRTHSIIFQRGWLKPPTRQCIGWNCGVQDENSVVTHGETAGIDLRGVFSCWETAQRGKKGHLHDWHCHIFSKDLSPIWPIWPICWAGPTSHMGLTRKEWVHKFSGLKKHLELFGVEAVDFPSSRWYRPLGFGMWINLDEEKRLVSVCETPWGSIIS